MGPGLRRDSNRNRREVHLDMGVHLAPDNSSCAGQICARGLRRARPSARRRRVGQCDGRFLSAAARRHCACVREPPARRRDLGYSGGHRSPGSPMVGSRPHRGHGPVDAARGHRERRRLCRYRPCDEAEFRRADRDRSGIARRRCRVRPYARAGDAPDHRHLRRWDGQFRAASGRGAQPHRRGGDHDQRARYPHRGAVAGGVLPQQRNWRPRRLCRRRAGFP